MAVYVGTCVAICLAVCVAICVASFRGVFSLKKLGNISLPLHVDHFVLLDYLRLIQAFLIVQFYSICID